MHNTQVQEFATAIGRGAQLIVVDPRFSVAASKAKFWLPIKPGTDIALLLAWMNVIIAEKRYDADYVAKYASAHEAHVRVARRNGAAVVEVRDDGVGGARPGAGTGLRGLADRLAALDGRLEIESPPGRGTLVRAWIPCA